MEKLTEKSSYEDFCKVPIVITKGGLKEVLDYLASDEYAEKMLQYADKYYGYNKKQTMYYLTEKSSYEDLYKAWNIVNDYSERAMRAKEMKSSFKNKDELFCRECNAPGKIPALYIVSYDKINKCYVNMPFLVVEGSEGRSFVAGQGNHVMDKNLIIIRSHAVSRYIERHGWEGKREDCERYLLSYMWVVCREEDPITKEFWEYFDEGLFMGYYKNGIYYTNTYVANQHLYPNQRLSSLRMEKDIRGFFEELRKEGYD